MPYHSEIMCTSSTTVQHTMGLNVLALNNLPTSLENMVSRCIYTMLYFPALMSPRMAVVSNDTRFSSSSSPQELTLKVILLTITKNTTDNCCQYKVSLEFVKNKGQFVVKKM